MGKGPRGRGGCERSKQEVKGGKLKLGGGKAGGQRWPKARRQRRVGGERWESVRAGGQRRGAGEDVPSQQ